MKRLQRFWNSLDDIPATATDRLEWRDRLGDEWPQVEPYLKATGQQATATACPSPGGDGCPRNVVRHPDGRIRAVCGCHPRNCDPLDLTLADVAVLALDRDSLLRDLCRVLNAEPTGRMPSEARVVLVGRHAVVAGVACPILLAYRAGGGPLTEQELRDGGLDSAGSVVLTPSPASLTGSLHARLLAAGHQVLPLSEVVALGDGGRLAGLQPPPVLLAPMRDVLLARLQAKSGAPVMHLPPGTDWGQITLTLTSAATLICTTPGWSRQIDPGELGMRSAKNSKPTLAWVLLMGLAAQGGTISVRDRAAEAKFRKQKEALSSRLRVAFGLSADPLPWDSGQRAYVARFLVRDERPLEDREPRRRR